VTFTELKVTLEKWRKGEFALDLKRGISQSVTVSTL